MQIEFEIIESRENTIFCKTSLKINKYAVVYGEIENPTRVKFYKTRESAKKEFLIEKNNSK